MALPSGHPRGLALVEKRTDSLGGLVSFPPRGEGCNGVVNDVGVNPWP